MIVPDNKCATNAIFTTIGALEITKKCIFTSANYDSTIVIAEKTRYKLKVLPLCIRIELH